MARLKRLAAPWHIDASKGKFVVCPAPGPHPKKGSIPLSVLLRDHLGCVQTLKEAKHVLRSNMVKVNNTVRVDYKFPVGMLDVVSIGSEHYRLLPSRKGLFMKKIDEHESRIKPFEIREKTTVRGGVTQLNLSGGRNMLIKDSKYAVGDVLVIDMLNMKITDAIKKEKGSMVLVVKGKNMGAVGHIEDIRVIKSSLPDIFTIKIGNKNVDMPKDFVLAIGREKPVISLEIEEK